MSKKLKLQAEKNFLKLVYVLAKITHSIDAYQALVDISNRSYPIFVDRCQSSPSYTLTYNDLSDHALKLEQQEGTGTCEKIRDSLTETQLLQHKQEIIVEKLRFLKELVPHQSFIIALLYIDRACRENKTFLLNSQNVIKIAFAFILIASKFIEEEVQQKQSHIQRSSSQCNFRKKKILNPTRGIIENGGKMKQLELEVLILIDFKAYVSKQEYDQYQKQLNRLFQNISMNSEEVKPISETQQHKQGKVD